MFNSGSTAFFDIYIYIYIYIYIIYNPDSSKQAHVVIASWKLANNSSYIKL